MSINDRYLDRIARDIDAHGLAAVECDVATIVDHARHVGADGAAVDVLADLTASDVARMRAFGLVAVRLAAAGAVTQAPADTAPRATAGV